MNTFTLGGKCSADFGIIMTKPPALVSPERDVEAHPVPGRSGNIIMDNGRYKNVTVPYECALIPPDDMDFRTAAILVVDFLKPFSAYKRLENTYDPSHFRLARVSSAISVESIVEQAGTFKIQFDCVPQRYLVEGETEISMASAGTLINPTAEDAQPLITVYGSGEGTLVIGDRTVVINELAGTLILDCKNQNAYYGAENLNGTIRAIPFPVLVPGENAISWTGGVTNIKIIPRWWTT